MGMAASQARYLALTARKTNTEYEGQQINQARTALANQSANLFNRLLNMEVPNPPKTSDYTKVQYSYSDGENASVIDEWKQLSGVNPDYNYLVKSHYFASMYTGAMRQLTDPQVQVGGNGALSNNWRNNWSTIALNKGLLDAADEAQQNEYNSFQQTKAAKEIDILNEQTAAYINNSGKSLVDSAIDTYEIVHNTGYDTYTLTNSETQASYNVYHYTDENLTPTGNADIILNGVRDMLDTNLLDYDTLNQYIVGSGGNVLINDDNIGDIIAPGNPYNEVQKEILKVFGLETNGVEPTTSRIVRMEDVDNIGTDADPDGRTTDKHQLRGTFLNAGVEDESLKHFADNVRGYKQDIADAEGLYVAKYNIYTNLLDNYNNNVTKPTYIGNSELTPILKEELTDNQKTELLQVVKDMKAENIDTDILDCFDEAGDYWGGIYSFKMNGTTYYTTQKSLEDAYYNSYPGNHSNNIIDGQYKMPYYNASYVDKRIEQESYALLETDGDGRFKTVKFENNSVVYSLNTETITDEAAYEDAMNKYLYEKDKYEKTIADINAKTSIIQKEDRTLELRLKQLDTEQNALKTEMDAVKKVIKDNVESTFKTFSD